MSLRVISFNANGIRAADRHGFFTWLQEQQADLVCIQETKAQYQRQLSGLPQFSPKEFFCYYADAEKKGYSGTAIFSRIKPQKITVGLGWEPADSEGRWIMAHFPGLCVASLYMPSGTSGEERQQVKYRFMEHFEKDLRQFQENQQQHGTEYIICADWNICHRPIDLKNDKANEKNSGYLPEERQWLTELYRETDWRDAFRLLKPDAEVYTWWSQRANARANNVGWRLDYPLITRGLHDRIVAGEICRTPYFSDHAPLIMDYDLTLQPAS